MRRGASTLSPRGIWSDRTTMWVVDISGDKLEAFDLDTGDRQPENDIDSLAAAGNTDPKGVWSDGTTVWVSDVGDDKVFAYGMADGARQLARELDTLT